MSKAEKTNSQNQDLQDEKMNRITENKSSKSANAENPASDKWEIPSDWEVKALYEIGDVSSGGTPDTTNEIFWNGNINWCTPTDITKLNGSKYIGETVVKITNAGLKNSSARLLPIGSVIVCTRATIGKAAISNKEISTNQGFKNIIPNKKANTDFLYYSILNSENKLLRLGNGSTFLEISKNDFEKFKISLPPFPEQTAIAQLLSTWDNAITKTQALIAQKEQLKKWLMQNLLTGKMRLKINDELGVINDELKKVNLKDVFQFIKSYSISREGLKISKDKNSTYCIHYGDIHSLYENDFLDFAKQHNIPQLRNEISINETDYLKDGDIIMADASEDYDGVGEAVEVCNLEHRKAIGGLHTIVLRGNTKIISPNYSAYLFSSENVRNKLRKMANGTSVYSVSKSTLHNLSLIIHNSLKEQTAIAKVLQAADKEIQLLKTKCDKLKEQKKGLMQVLLTGKKRLIIK